MYKYLLFIVSMVVILFLSQNVFADGQLQLSKNSTTHYVIVRQLNAIPSEKTAAKQLQKYLHIVTGATFPIKAVNEVNINAPQILIGQGKRAKSLLPQMDWSSLGEGGIVIKTVGNRLILAGGRPRGTLYAVFQFLENTVGCRWWTPTESTIPHKSTLVIKAQNTVYVPQFTYREDFSISTRKNPVFATILRLNGTRKTQTEKWGGHFTLIGRVHSMVRMVPLDKYFKKHPEWYTDPRNHDRPCTASSKRPTVRTTQLCLMNPQVIDALTQAALKRIKAHPNAGYIDISQGDNQYYCKGPKCMRLIKAQGSPSAPIIRAVNIVAGRIHKKYPNVKVETLAYQYSIKPPKTIRPAKNVIIRLAPIGADFGHPIYSPKWNAKPLHDILSWGKISPQLFIWQYATNFGYAMLPHPNLPAMAKSFRFYTQHKVKAIFVQDDGYTNGVGDFAQMRNWLVGHLLWNPNQDLNKLEIEFLNGYYGAAGPYLYKYLDLIQNSFLAQNRRLSTFNLDFSFINLDVANKAIQLFNQAENAVKDNPAQLARVERTRLSLQAAIFHQWRTLHKQIKQTEEVFLGPKNLQKAAAVFKKTAHSFGVRYWGERKPFDKGFGSMIAQIEQPHVPLPDFARQYPRAQVIDIQPGALSLAGPKFLRHVVNDSAASDKKAVAIEGDTGAWACQVKLSVFALNNQMWRVYAHVRVDAKPGAAVRGYGMSSGIYDRTLKKGVAVHPIKMSKIAGKKYHWVDLGAYRLNSGMYIWFAPFNKPRVKKVYIDRIVLINEK